MVYADIDVDTDIWFDDSPPLWTPLDLGAAVKSWWNADDHGTANMVDDGGGLISSWKARTSGINPTATTTARPTWNATSFNGKAGVTGDGVANILRTTTFSGGGVPVLTTPGEIFVLANQTSAAVDAVYMHYGAVSGTSRIISHDPGLRFKAGDAVVTLTSIAPTPTTVGNIVLVGIFNPTNMSGRINGQLTSPATSGVSSLNTPNTGALTLFAYNSAVPTFFNACTMRHVIVTTALTIGQRVRLEGWLAWDGGIQATLPVGHPYRNAPPTTAWTPYDLDAALAAWWSADDHGMTNMTDDGAGLISAWRDRVSANNLIGTTTQRPTWGASSFNSAYAGVVANGTTNVLRTTASVNMPVSSNPSEIWLVTNNGAGVINGQMLVSYGTTGGQFRVLNHTTVPNLMVYDGIASLIVTTPSPFIGNFIVGASWAATAMTARINGSPSVPASQTIALATGSTPTFTLFAYGDAVQLFNACTHRHVLVTATTLTALQRQQLEGWLAWDSGLTSLLPAGHPYKSVRP